MPLVKSPDKSLQISFEGPLESAVLNLFVSALTSAQPRLRSNYAHESLPTKSHAIVSIAQ